jgi:hypothetical protein
MKYLKTFNQLYENLKEFFYADYAEHDDIKEFLKIITNKELLNKKWGVSGTQGLLYKGVNVFDLYLSDYAYQKFDEVIKRDEELTLGEDVSYQEVYLGYFVDYDQFMIGFDVFTADTKSILLSFQISNGEIVETRIDDANSQLFYSSIYRGITGYRVNNPNGWIDLRLD